MKKNILFLFSIISILDLSAQNIISNGSFEKWTDNNPDGWVGAKTNIDTTYIVKSDTSAFDGDFSVQLINTGTRDKYFTCKPLNVVAGESYVVTYAVKGTGVIRVGIYDTEFGKRNPSYNATGNWQEYSEIVTATNSTEAGEFIFYIKSTTQEGLFLDKVEVTEYFGADILNFELAEEIRPAYIDSKSAQVSSTLHWSADLSKLDPIITIHEGAQVTATIVPVVFDGINPVEYKVTAAEGNVKFWSIFVTLAKAPSEVSIYDIQYTELESGDSPLKGKLVNTNGIVTGFTTKGFFLQDGTGEWTGIWVNTTNDTTIVKTGDNLTLIGKVNENNNLTEITDLLDLTINSSGKTLPLATPATISTNMEPYEGVLSSIETITCITEPTDITNWSVADDSLNVLAIGNEMFAYDAILDEKFSSITGIITYASGNYILLPRDRNDLVIAVGLEQIQKNTIILYPNPTKNQLTIENMVNINKVTVSNILGQSIFVRNIIESSLILNTSDLKSGIYLINFIGNDGSIYSQKFMKE